MLYHYVASDNQGKLIDGEVDADDVKQALRFLAGKELRPVSLKPAQGAKTIGFSGKIALVDKVFIAKYLALMLKMGTDLLSAINILIYDFDKPAVKNFLLEVRENLSRGQPFYKAFEAHERIFSKTVVSLIKAAEVSGNLQKTFEQLSVSLEKEAELRGKIRSALIYPVILLLTSSAITIFLVTSAIPKVAKVFSDSGIEPPLFSRVVFGFGLFVGNHIVLIFSIVFGLAALGMYGYRTAVGKRMFEVFLRNLPFIRNIYRDIAIQRLASTMSSLMKAGLPIIETVNVAAEAIGIGEFQSSLTRVANEGLAKGLTIGDAFKRETVFPKSVSNLIAISEKAGHLDEVLETLADFYASNVDASIKTAVSLVEPALLLTMGFVVAAIALSIILPVYQLTTQF
ncbi:MAG: type II secretion system F family protein [Candidatus Liptonbacteria bacterium]|nr:type II secretion system F family protein [Candidatus Liptonbacteria bacterium]